jgi:thiol-disulfide isomerase/thioredoxin
MFLLLSALAFAAPELIPEEAWNAAKATPAAPDFELALRGGGVFKLAEHRTKPLVLSFWASWCGPCRKELPALVLFAKEHPEVEVLTVNVDRDPNAVERFLTAVPLELTIALDPQAKALGSYGVTAMPTLFLLDKAGGLAYTQSGFAPDKGFAALGAALASIP